MSDLVGTQIVGFLMYRLKAAKKKLTHEVVMPLHIFDTISDQFQALNLVSKQLVSFHHETIIVL